MPQLGEIGPHDLCVYQYRGCGLQRNQLQRLVNKAYKKTHVRDGNIKAARQALAFQCLDNCAAAVCSSVEEKRRSMPCLSRVLGVPASSTVTR